MLHFNPIFNIILMAFSFH